MRHFFYIIIGVIICIGITSSCKSKTTTAKDILEKALANNEQLSDISLVIQGGSQEETVDVMINASVDEEVLLYEGIHYYNNTSQYLVMYNEKNNLYLKQSKTDEFLELSNSHPSFNILTSYINKGKEPLFKSYYNKISKDLEEDFFNIEENIQTEYWTSPVTSINFTLPKDLAEPIYRENYVALLEDNINSQVENRITTHKLLAEQTGQILTKKELEELKEHYLEFDIDNLESLLSDFVFSDFEYTVYINEDNIIVYTHEKYSLTINDKKQDYSTTQQLMSYNEPLSFPSLDEEKIINHPLSN
ncbi:MAG: hypothetical protein ACLFMO_05885 [Eubacteriales bacterium]